MLANIYLHNYSTKSRFAEAYRTLRTNILFSFMDKDLRLILITSAGQSEGKTSTIANLAYTIAQTGKSVLMIDADLRKPKLHQLASFNNSQGLTGLLANLFATEISKGDLADFGISDLYRLLTLQKKTGFLQLSDAKEELELFFLQGELMDLNWHTRPDERKLANVLVNNELLTADQAKRALSRQKDTGQKLAFILINMGLLNQEQLIGPLTIQMMEGLRTALQLKTGQFAFKAHSDSDFDRASFDPVDFRKLHQQLIVGEEELPYLQTQISATILRLDADNIFLLPAGSLPPNPSELLGSVRMSFLLSFLKKRFDMLVIDTPPIMPASDALLLAPQADGVIIMIKPGLMNRKLIRKAVEQIQLTQANLLGVVLNQVDTKRDGYYKYYYKYYSKYYGEEE